MAIFEAENNINKTVEMQLKQCQKFLKKLNASAMKSIKSFP